jgi:hypothetical protein
MSAAYSFAPTVEGLAAQILQMVKTVFVDKPDLTTSVRIEDATIDILYRRNLVIVVSFDKPADDAQFDELLNDQTEVEESDESEDPDQVTNEEVKSAEAKPEEKWEVVTSKKKKDLREFWVFRNLDDCGVFDFVETVTGFESVKPQTTWSHAYCPTDNMIHSFHFKDCISQEPATNEYVQAFEEWQNSRDSPIEQEWYVFREVSNWHTWKFIDVCTNVREVCALIELENLEWSHVFSQKDLKLFDVRVKSDAKMYWAKRDVSLDYIKRFHTFVLNRFLLDKIPADAWFKEQEEVVEE